MALTDNLAAHWRLDESSGNATDAHGSTTLTDNNTVTTAAGKIGTARQFTRANNEYLSAVDNASLSPGADTDLSMTGWVYLDSTTQPQILWGKGSTNSGTTVEYQLVYESNVFRFYIGNGSSFSSVTASNFGAPTAATWYFIAVWHDATGDTIGISVNDGTPNTAAWASGTWDGAGEFRIGRDPGYASALDGRADSVSVWIGKALSAAEITTLYNGGSGLDYPFSTGITGTASITLAGATVASTSALAIAGTAGLSLAGATVAATGQVAIAGSLSVTLDGCPVVGAAVLPIAGGETTTLEGATVAATGAVAIAASAGLSLAGATVAAAGSLSLSGALTATLAGATLAAAGGAFTRPTIGITKRWSGQLGRRVAWSGPVARRRIGR